MSATSTTTRWPKFIHRPDLIRQGFVSVCTLCAATAATAEREEDLATLEVQHVCDIPMFKKPPQSTTQH